MFDVFHYVDLVTPYTPAECLARLGPHVDTTYFRMQDKPCLGTLSLEEMSIFYRKYYRYDFRTALDVWLEPAPDGKSTRIHGTVGADPFTLGITGLVTGVFGLAFICFAVSAINAAFRGDWGGRDWTPLRVTGGGLLVALPCIISAARLSGSSRRWLVNFIQETLDAVPYEESGSRRRAEADPGE